MKHTKLITSTLAAGVLAAGLGITSTANAEFSGSVAIASSYQWRGFELGSGTPAVSGDLSFSAAGFSAGIWGSSGDTTAGSEYDLYVGYEQSFGDFTAGISVVSYIYPTGDFSETEGPGDFMEAILSLGYGPVSFNYHDNIAGETGGYAFDEDYTYWYLSLSLGQFGIGVGSHDEGDVAPVTGNATHLDLSYAYNDNLSFAYSLIVDSDEPDAGFAEKEPFFVVSYSIPIE